MWILITKVAKLIFVIIPICAQFQLYKHRWVTEESVKNQSDFILENVLSHVECAGLCTSNSIISNCDGFKFDKDNSTCQFLNSTTLKKGGDLGTDILMRGDKEPGISCVTPTIIQEDLDFHLGVASNTFQDNTCDVKSTTWNFWTGTSWTNNVGFIVDLGCPATISEISLRNAYNGGNKDRSTDHYTVHGSLQPAPYTWQLLVQDRFNPPAIPAACSMPLVTFPLAIPVEMRYIKFTAVDYSINGASLQYLGYKEVI